MLLEEKVYEEQTSMLIMNDNDHQVMQISEKKENARRREKVKITHSNNSFGFAKLITSLTFATLLIVFMQAAYYMILSPKALKITNLVKVYIIEVEIWSAFITIHTFAMQVLLWNNTVPTWNTDSLTAYEMQRSHIRGNLIPNFTEALDYNMGNYTEVFRNQISKVTQKPSKYFLREILV